MHRFALPFVAGLSLSLAACPDSTDFQSGASGVPLWQAFNFSTLRTWTFLSDAGFDNVDYRLRARQLEGTEEIDGDPVHTIEFQYDCIQDNPRPPGGDTDVGDTDAGPAPVDDSCAAQELEATVAFTWRLSSSLENGVRVHAWGDTVFDPPMTLANARMLEGDTVESTSGDITYTSTYVDLEPCPAETFWPDPDNRADCYRLEVTAEGGTSPVVGTWWAASRFLVPAFQQDGGPKWELIGFEAAD